MVPAMMEMNSLFALLLVVLVTNADAMAKGNMCGFMARKTKSLLSTTMPLSLYPFAPSLCQ